MGRPLSPIAALSALLGPALVLGAAAWALMGFRDADDAMADRNAGRILNAQVIDGDAAAAMDRILEARDPEILVLGPSYANTNVRPGLLAATVGADPSRIALLSVPNSVGSHWYAILKYRLFEAGYRPKLVVVVSGLQSMLLTTPLTESSFVNLRVQLPDEGDPLIRRKVTGSADLAWARIREQRGKVRSHLFARLRSAAVFWWDDEQTRAALGRVFDDRGVDMSLHGTSVPVVESSLEGERAYTPDLLPAPADSFLADVTQLAREHGTQIVWVRPPMSPHIPEHLDDIVPVGVHQAAVAQVEAQGGRFVDMRSLPMTSAMFRNEDHMNEEGSRRFTAALAAALVESFEDSPTSHPFDDARVQIRTTPEHAVPPDLSELPGSGLWLPPGSTTTISADKPWDPATPFLLSVAAEHLGVPGDPPPLRLEHDGLRAPLRANGTIDGRTRWVGQLQTAAPTEPFTVTLTVNPRHWVRVNALAVGPRLSRFFLVGDLTGLQGARVRLLGGAELRDGTVVRNGLRPTYSKPPVRVPGHDRPVTDLGGLTAAFETERWAFLSDEATRGATSWGRRCSPLRILEDGTLLPNANVPCSEVRRGEGRSCHTTERIYFSASDATNPATNGRTYRLVLDDSRTCDTEAWIYPVDTLRLPIPPTRLEPLTRGAARMTLDLRYLNFRPAEITVRLRASDRVLVEETLDGRRFHGETVTWILDPPLRPEDEPAQLEIDNLAHTFYLLREVTFSEVAGGMTHSAEP
ncbi:MAG: hypothetical protein KTR31_25555 [Myxococcales bacterium]|nr:hypothetical protein [Myxococcales bacterium]